MRITESNPTIVISNGDCAPCRDREQSGRRAVIQGIEAVQMIRKGQVLGIGRDDRHGQAWVFASLLGMA